MLWLLSLVLTIIYIIWLSRLISFGVTTATRIAVASETTALAMSGLYKALSPEARERAELAMEQIKQEIVKEQRPQQLTAAASNGLTNAIFAVVIGICALVFALFVASMAHAGERDTSRSFYDRNGSFAGSTIQHGSSTSAYDKSGRFNGSAIRNSDGTTSFYDKRGRFTGSSTNTSQPK
jgi:hypothetical protein